MKWVYSDWAPGRIGVVDHDGCLLEAIPSKFQTEAQMGEMSAIELAIPWVQNSNEECLILTDSLSAAKMLSGNPYRPHPRAKFPEEQIKMALRIRAHLQIRSSSIRRGTHVKNHIVAWIPRAMNLAHQPLAEADL